MWTPRACPGSIIHFKSMPGLSRHDFFSMRLEKRVLFKSAWLPWVLIAPQMAIILVFFFWPAGQALYQSVLQEDAFGSAREFVGLDNFRRLFNDPSYLDSFRITAIFSALVAVGGLVISLRRDPLRAH